MSGSVDSANLFWDSCVIIRYLTGVPPTNVPDIDLFLAEAKAGKRRIYISSMMVPEVKPYQLKNKNYDNFQHLLDAMQDAFVIRNPNMNILMQAARLRNYQYYPQQMQATEKKRVLTGMDAVHLATCLYVRDVEKVLDIVFHTFDDGKSKNYEEKAVSLLNFEKFATHLRGDPDVDAVCNLTRCRPDHPTRPLV